MDPGEGNRAEVLSAHSDQNCLMLTTVIFQHQIFAAPPSGGEIVRALYDALLSTMKDGRSSVETFGSYIAAQFSERFDTLLVTKTGGN